MMNELPSKLLNASAGFGKTEALVTNLIVLLCQDPKALHSSATMTFARAAAGEIYDRLLELLYQAVLDGSRLEQLRRRDALLTKFDRAAALALLVELTANLNSLQISTIDSFMTKIVLSYPFELQLPGSAELIGEAEAYRIRERILRELFAAAVRKNSTGEFIAAVKEASFGAETKTVFDSCSDLLRSLDRFHALQYRDDAWNPPLSPRHRQTDLANCYRQAEAILEQDLTSAQSEKILNFLETCIGYDEKHLFSTDEWTPLKAFFDCWEEFQNGTKKPAGFSLKPRYSYPKELIAAMTPILEYVADLLLLQAARRTAGMQKLLVAYSTLYRRESLDRGKLTFSDLPRLLNAPEAEEWTNDISFRLNSELHHWLLDEFQDTSRDQWEVVRRIIDSTGDGRTLFAVGDPKQAIYGWRAGDRRLMAELLEDPALPLQAETLPCSYRYGASICDALNLIFSPDHMNASGLPEATRREWGRIWNDHRSARDFSCRFAALALLPEEEEEENAGEAKANERLAKRYAAIIAARLKELDYRKNQLNCGILVRNAAQGVLLRAQLSAVDETLRDDLIWEGDDTITRDRLVLALVSLTVFLQHPEDRVAGEIVRMSQPLRRLVDENRRELLRRLEIHGFSGLLRYALRRLEQKVLLADRNQTGLFEYHENECVEKLLLAARQFDLGPENADAIAFRDYIKRCKTSESALVGKIKLMTIHHSKGLSFDVVFTPFFPSQSNLNLLKPSPNEFIVQSASGNIEWLLHNPRAAAWTRPELVAAMTAQLADQAYEDLCCTYVALTRAKYECTVLLPPLGKGKGLFYHPQFNPKFKQRQHLAQAPGISSYYMSDFLFEQFFFDQNRYPESRKLPCLAWGNVKAIASIIGDDHWLNEYQERQANQPEPVPVLPLTLTGRAAIRKRRLSPSSQEDAPQANHFDAGAFRFRLPGMNSGTEFGTQVHAMFEAIEYLEDDSPSPQISPELAAHYRICAASPEVRELLGRTGTRPPWRERKFEVILKRTGQWVSGCFDRVNFHTDARGTLLGATIVDYKSNQIRPDEVDDYAQVYAGQMASYAAVLAQLLDLPLEKINCVLLFTRLGIVRHLDSTRSAKAEFSPPGEA